MEFVTGLAVFSALVGSACGEMVGLLFCNIPPSLVTWGRNSIICFIALYIMNVIVH